MTNRLDPLALLERVDKWYLADGQGAVYAPKFPVFPDAPGFWDECYLANLRLERLFTVLITENRRPIHLTLCGSSWRPDRLLKSFTAPGLTVTEDRAVVSKHVFVSCLTIRNESDSPREFDLLQWSMQLRQETQDIRGLSYAVDAAYEAEDYCRYEQSCTFSTSPADRAKKAAGAGTADLVESDTPEGASQESSAIVHVVLGADRNRESFTINLSEITAANPVWEISTFPEKFESGRLPGETKVDVGWNQIGFIHIGQQYKLQLRPGEEASVTFGAAVGLDLDEATGMLSAVLAKDAIAESKNSWEEYFASLPYFECTDPYLTKYYWYRWYGLRLCTVDVGVDELQYPCVFEGIDMFRHHVGYSAHVHMLETSWMPDPSLAQGSFLSIFNQQSESGEIPGHLGLVRGGWSFYHGNWGYGLTQVQDLHRDMSFTERVYPMLAKYAHCFKRERDAEDSGMYDVIDQNETGQEYSSRYLFASEAADEWRRFQLKGVDATTYMYLVLRSLEDMACALGKPQESKSWGESAEKTRNAVREKMWDPECALFLDVHPETGERSFSQVAVSFYPFMTDIVTEDHLQSIDKHLLNPNEYWTPFPVPSSSLTDPYFSAEPEWKDKRMICPWNGRTWPMVNSHIVEALAITAERFNKPYGSSAAELLSKYIRMMFWDGDLARPNCFEHYNPLTGMPCGYRGIDDYQHSWVVDLIIKYVAGLRTGGGTLIEVKPLDFGLDSFVLDNVHYRGRTVKIRWEAASGLSVHVDGQLVAFSKVLEPLAAKL